MNERVSQMDFFRECMHLAERVPDFGHSQVNARKIGNKNPVIKGLVVSCENQKMLDKTK